MMCISRYLNSPMITQTHSRQKHTAINMRLTSLAMDGSNHVRSRPNNQIVCTYKSKHFVSKYTVLGQPHKLGLPIAQWVCASLKLPIYHWLSIRHCRAMWAGNENTFYHVWCHNDLYDVTNTIQMVARDIMFLSMIVLIRGQKKTTGIESHFVMFHISSKFYAPVSFIYLYNKIVYIELKSSL